MFTTQTRPRARIRGFTLIAIGVWVLFAPVAASAGDLSVIPLWDGETSITPDGPLINRFGGQPVQSSNVALNRTTSHVYSGVGAYRLDIAQPISPGASGFFLTALAPPEEFGVGRDLRGFDEARFWLKNDTGSAFDLRFEIKDYRDSSAHLAYREQLVPATTGWQRVSVPLDLNANGWQINGTPDLERSRFFGFVAQNNQNQPLDGVVHFDELTLIESGGPLDTKTATTEALAARLAKRQFMGLWGSRNRTNGLIPLRSSSNAAGAMNNTASVVKLLPGAIDRGWVAQGEADAYMQTLVQTLNNAMDSYSTYLPPRYMDMTTLAPTLPEESPIDAAFMMLSLEQFRSLGTQQATLKAEIASLQDRFNFAAFSDTTGPQQGWKLAYRSDTMNFSSGTYDGYSGEPWLISLAAHLSDSFHVDINEQYHSATKRTSDFLADSSLSHQVHALEEFRAPFLQWLMPLFADVSERGVDTYPIRSQATNPLENAQRYQRDVHAYLESIGRTGLLQPDAGDDGSGAYYRQFSAYDDHGRPHLLMPWSVAFGLLGDAPVGDAALRNLVDASLQSPLGLSDNAHWSTGASAPYQVTANHDLWNTSLATMGLVEYLYGESVRFAGLPAIEAALDEVFFLTWRGSTDGDWGQLVWNGNQPPPSFRNDARIVSNLVTINATATAHRTRVDGGELRIGGSLFGPLEVRSGGTLSGAGFVSEDVILEGAFRITTLDAAMLVGGMLELHDGSVLTIDESLTIERGTLRRIDLMAAQEGISGGFATPQGAGTESHLGNGLFLEEVSYDSHVVSVELLSAVPGDANGDRLVDGQDFIIWNQYKFQSGTSWIEGDFNQDGITDGKDFVLWNLSKFSGFDAAQRHGTSVPEPTGLPGVAAICVLALLRR